MMIRVKLIPEQILGPQYLIIFRDAQPSDQNHSGAVWTSQLLPQPSLPFSLPSQACFFLPPLALGQHFAQIPWPHTPCKGTVNFPTPTWAEVVQKAPHPVSRVTGRGATLEAGASPNTLSTASGCIPR